MSAMVHLFALLRSHRLPLDHATGVALNTRLLRHGIHFGKFAPGGRLGKGNAAGSRRRC